MKLRLAIGSAVLALSVPTGIAVVDAWTPAGTASADSVEREIDHLSRQGDLIAAFGRAVELLRERYETLGPEQPATLDAWDRVAKTAREAGDYDTTLEITQYTLEARRRLLGERHPAVALSLTRLAQVERNLGRLWEAEPLYRQALAIAEPLRSEYPEIYTEILYGWAFLQGRKDANEAIGTFERVLELTQSLGPRSPVPTSTVVTWIGWTLAHAGRHDEAAVELQRAERMLFEEGYSQSFDRGVILAAQGDLHALSGRWREASRSYERAMDIFERQRSMTPPGFSRRRVHFEASTKLALTLLKQQRWEEAWRAATRARGMLSLEFIAMGRWMLLDPESFGERQSIRRRLDALEETGSQPKPASRAERLLRRLELRARLFELEQAYLDRHEPEGLELSQLQAELPPRTAYVGWVNATIGNDSRVSHGESLTAHWIYIVREGSLEWIRLAEWTDPQTDRDLADSFSKYTEMLNRAAGWPLRVGPDEKLDAWQREWCRRFFDPALEHLEGIDSLIVEGGFVAPRVALEMMRGPDGTFIGDRFAISYIPSPVTLRLLTESKKPTRRSALVLGDPMFSATQPTDTVTPDMVLPSSSIGATHLQRATRGDRSALDRLPRLPLSRFEAERIAEMFPDSLLLTGVDASEREITSLASSERLGQFDVIHLATHTLFDDIPERCALALARSDVEDRVHNDGLINVTEILQGWSLNADVLTLSGCQAAAVIPDGARLLPFAQALLGAGARSVVASMWKVDDLATALLMTRFYENLTGARGDPMSKDRALQEARIWVRDYEQDDGTRPFAHPVYWSGFILIGSAH